MQGSYDGEAYAAEKAYYAEVAKAADTRQATKVVPEKGGPFDSMESPVRLSNAQVGWIYSLLRDPIVLTISTQEARTALVDIALLLIEATNEAIETYQPAVQS